MLKKEDVTFLVNTCDSYKDCWELFFCLFKKYWPENDCRIILNTESESFTYDGLNIESFGMSYCR